MESPTTIILLNGVGSVGKGSIARALQEITREPFLHVEMDAFMAMMPAAYHDHPDGMVFVHDTGDDGQPRVEIKTGAVAERTLTGMRRAVAELAACGNNMIVDDVLFGNVTTQYGNPVEEYDTLLQPYTFHKVGVFAPLETIEARERDRGDRTIGLARWQFGEVHKNMHYDLDIDTSTASPKECAERIKEAFHL